MLTCTHTRSVRTRTFASIVDVVAVAVTGGATCCAVPALPEAGHQQASGDAAATQEVQEPDDPWLQDARRRPGEHGTGERIQDAHHGTGEATAAPGFANIAHLEARDYLKMC